MYSLSWSWHYLSTSVEPSASFPFFHNSRFFEYLPDQWLPLHIHKPCFSKKRIFIILPCIVPVLAANLLFLYFFPHLPFLYFPPCFFLYCTPKHRFCIILQCSIISLRAFSALSFNVNFLYYPFTFLLRILLSCILSVLSPNVKFLYYSPVYRFCIIIPCFLSALSCRVPLLYCVPIYCFLIILPSTLYYVLSSYIFRLCIIFPRAVSIYHFPIHAWTSSYGKAAEHFADLLFHLRPRLRMCGSMLPLPRMPSWRARRQVYCFTLPSRVPYVLPITAFLI